MNILVIRCLFSIKAIKCENKVILECIEHNSHFGHDFSSQCENIKKTFSARLINPITESSKQ